MSSISIIHQQIDQQTLAVELARNEAGADIPVDDLLLQIGVSRAYYDQLMKDPLFQQQVKRLRREIEENGISFQMKSHIAAEDSLPVLYRIVNDPDTPPAAAIKGMEMLVRWANLEPKANVATQGAQFALNINLNPVSAGGATVSINTVAESPTKLPKNDGGILFGDLGDAEDADYE